MKLQINQEFMLITRIKKLKLKIKEINEIFNFLFFLLCYSIIFCCFEFKLFFNQTRRELIGKILKCNSIANSALFWSC